MTKFVNISTFINRKDEMLFLEKWIEEEPNIFFTCLGQNPVVKQAWLWNLLKLPCHKKNLILNFLTSEISNMNSFKNTPIKKNKKKLPIGTQDFEALKQYNEFYLDKTRQIFEIINLNRYNFLSRPRRFGKRSCFIIRGILII